MIKKAFGSILKIGLFLDRITDSEIRVSRYERNNVPNIVFSQHAAKKRQRPIVR
jgi:hypothetical protein